MPHIGKRSETHAAASVIRVSILRASFASVSDAWGVAHRFSNRNPLFSILRASLKVHHRVKRNMNRFRRTRAT
jgi:hypothetical protein